MYIIRKLGRYIFLLLMVVGLAACGGGGSSGSTPNNSTGGTPPTPALQVIALTISPGSTTVSLGVTQQFVATATYSDGSSQLVSSQVTWASSDTSRVLISNVQTSAGLANSVATGTVSISATLDNIRGEARFVVSPAALVSIDIFPSADVQIAISAEQQFVAVGTYTDGSSRDVTIEANWATLDASVVDVGTAAANKGMARGLVAGLARVQASIDAISDTVDLAVLPIQALDYGVVNSMGIGLGGLQVDAAGNVMTAWNYQFTGGGGGTNPKLYTAAFTQATDWQSKVEIDFGSINDFPALPQLATNPSGDALLAWVGHFGVYAARYTPDSGWQTAQTIISGTTPFLVFAGSLQLGIDANGNGLLVWSNDNGDRIISSQYQQATEAWTTPIDLPGVNRGAARGDSPLAMNANGDAVLLWQAWGFGTTPAWTLYASRFVSGSGWQMPQSLYQSETWHKPAVDINASGDIVAVWVDYVTDFPNNSVYSRRFVSNQGWQPLETVVPSDAYMPTGVKVAMNDTGDAVVVYYQAYNYQVMAKRYVANVGWQSRKVLWPAAGLGDPIVLQPYIAADGRIITEWVVGKVKTRRYLPSSGWDDVQELLNIGHKGKLTDINITFNAQGNGAAFWIESYDVFDGQFYNTLYDFYVDTQLEY